MTAVLPFASLNDDHITHLILLGFAIVAVWRAIVKDKAAARKADREERSRGRIERATQEVKTTLQEGAVVAAKEREQIREDLDKHNSVADTRLGRIEDTGHKVHVLVNNRMLLVLEDNVKMARELAALYKTEEARAFAEQAQRALAEQRAKQSIVDRLQPPSPDQGGATP